ncbi:MAG: UvrD-helicase domain-containing protein [Simkaniaceae bacterium]|nr:UvrD-helicase domain-containing protein [Simkaniaceae bacterium]
MLNPVQEKCVEHVEGPLLVLAGAGSGKTRVVTHRIAHLIEVGVPAHEILGLTFTNKAAAEMQSRIKQLCSQNVWISTFHSLCAAVLRESMEQNFTIYDAQDSETVIKNALASLEVKADKSMVRSIKAAISKAKNDLTVPDDDQLTLAVYERYEQLLKTSNAMDFDDLLVKTIELLENDAEKREHYQKRWAFILIDEYQDTNHAQYKLIKLLCAAHNNLFVVGDPDQSIYSFRGANVRNILQFEEDFPGAKVITLDQNYRSTQNILNAANAVIEENTSRYEKNLWSDLGEGEKIKTYLAGNDREEADYVIEQIEDRLRRGETTLDETVIFYRVNAQSRSYEDALLRANLPYVIIGGISFYQRREIKDILALLRLSVSPYDFLSFARMINIPKRGIGNKTITNMHTHAEGHQIPIMELCEKILEGEEMKLSPRQTEGLRHFVAVIRLLQKDVAEKIPLPEIVLNAIERSEYLGYLREDPDTFDDRRANLDELINKAAEFEEDNHDATLMSFLEELTLKSSADEKQIGESIKLMTVHNGKGLEFTTAFVVGMEEDLFPHINCVEEGIEEERRLCYVAMTRAKRYLYMTASKYRLIWGTPKFMRPSRFFQELPNQYVEKDGGFIEVQESSGELEPGATVKHQSFGLGTVQKAYTTSLGPTVDVHFHDLNSTKTLVAKYAKLQVV